MSKLKDKAGYTLIELVVTFAITGILAAVALPKYLNYINVAHNAKINTVVSALKNWSTMYAVDNYNSNGNFVYPLPNSAVKSSVISSGNLPDWDDSDPSNWQYYAGGGITLTGDGSYFKVTPIYIP